MSKKQPTSKPAVDEPALMKRANFFMPPTMIEGLNTMAQRKGGTASEHLRKAVQAYLRRNQLPV